VTVVAIADEAELGVTRARELACDVGQAPQQLLLAQSRAEQGRGLR